MERDAKVGPDGVAKDLELEGLEGESDVGGSTGYVREEVSEGEKVVHDGGGVTVKGSLPDGIVRVEAGVG